ncbi:cytochrome c3 family protein [Hyalangium rubrum]|uniref:Cytochrome c3 family protein n=1 Tax=Hyalangium rubrum TaxID=3103134 RepID=A0ABU5H5B3_9BACT|nr:cytochrome c3 family protein [Hyalangium sp. s54d21]MDY7228648.1 cytochrome c3 family protein [Hyalangium sp. s54d21]
MKPVGAHLRGPYLAWGLGLALLGVVAGAALRATVAEVRTPVALADVAYTGSASCRPCHPDHYASWRRTFHRTMTQEASPTAVLGDFSGVSFTYAGVTSRFLREGEGFVIETLDGQGQLRRQAVARTVGSRRVQQYLVREDDRFIRLPVAWDIAQRRWFHLTGGFLDPDGTDFNAHRALWNANCIFCHNVKAQPGYDWERSRFDSHVAELGIACEACHGPGTEHVARNASPLRRYYLHASEKEDRSIVNPLRLDALRRIQVCGHCHGQRLPSPVSRIRQFLSEGDPYTAGEDLSTYTRPLYRESHLEGVNVALRFWKDGTPRLTAYEYQGLLLTKDFQRGGLTCQHCHTMHGGDPKGMITQAMRGPAACQSCHPAIVARAAEHSRHREGSSGTDCYACHMPKVTYGILEVHPTHRIQVPDPARAWWHEMPEACTLCHTDRSARWAEQTLREQQGRAPAEDLPTDPAFEVAESVRTLLSGDVVQRAVAASALGDERSAMTQPVARLWAVPFLVQALEDNYPSIRRMAWRSIETLVARAGEARPELTSSAARLPRFDPQASAEERARVVQAWRQWWAALDTRDIPRPDAAVPLDASLEPLPTVIEQLLRRRAAQPPIQIGE